MQEFGKNKATSDDDEQDEYEVELEVHDAQDQEG